MIHPSYQELIATINEGQDIDETPVISSRYSLVLATSKRARQIVAGAEPLVKMKKGMKPLSTAVEEMWKGEVTILSEEDAAKLIEEDDVEALEVLEEQIQESAEAAEE